MRFFSALRVFNTVAFAVFSVLGIAFLGLNLHGAYMEKFGTDSDQAEARRAARSSIKDEPIDAGGRKIQVLSQGKENDEFVTDLRFVDSRDGSVVRLTSNPATEIYGGRVVGLPATDGLDSGYGYFALAKTSEQDGQPKFDALFVRFADMKIFKISGPLLAFDLTELDGHSFSAILWDEHDRGRFILFDSVAGMIVASKDLDMQGHRLSNLSEDANAAPKNKFGF